MPHSPLQSAAMLPTDIQSMLRRFINFAIEPGEKTDEVMLELCDRVLVAFHDDGYSDTRYSFNDEEHSEAPREDYTTRRMRVMANFPSYGFYHSSAAADDEVSGEDVLGDAVSDLADLVGDFQEILWRFDNTGVDDALWHFHNGYWTHWGLHMRELQLYLFRRLTKV